MSGLPVPCDGPVATGSTRLGRRRRERVESRGARAARGGAVGEDWTRLSGQLSVMRAARVCRISNAFGLPVVETGDFEISGPRPAGYTNRERGDFVCDFLKLINKRSPLSNVAYRVR